VGEPSIPARSSPFRIFEREDVGGDAQLVLCASSMIAP
jgi:hypothetical protein